MRELSNNCNQLSEELRHRFEQIDTHIQEFEKDNSNLASLKKIQELLKDIEYKGVEFTAVSKLKKDAGCIEKSLAEAGFSMIYYNQLLDSFVD